MHLSTLKDIVAMQVEDAGELATVLELSVEDIMERFSDKLLEHKDKFVQTADDGHDEA